jgi:hypothetical protein
MSQLRSQPMSLFQVTIPRDYDWDIVEEFLRLDFVHYIDLNAYQQPHQLLYHEVLRRAEETSKKIAVIEDIYKEFNVHMQAPSDVSTFETAIQNIEGHKKKASSHLFSEIEAEIDDQEQFLRKQRGLIMDSLVSFKVILSRMSVLAAIE